MRQTVIIDAKCSQTHLCFPFLGTPFSFNDRLDLFLKFLYGDKWRYVCPVLRFLWVGFSYVTQNAGQIIPENGTDIPGSGVTGGVRDHYSRARERDSIGRYSRNSGDLVEHMDMMMEEAETPQERELIERFKRELEKV